MYKTLVHAGQVLLPARTAAADLLSAESQK